MYLNMARLLWAFDFSRAVKDGNPITPTGEMIYGWMSIPAPFECDIRVRGPGYAKIIEKEWADAKRGLDASGDLK